MQFRKVKKEIIHSKKRDFVQNHTFYAKKKKKKKKERFSAERKNMMCKNQSKWEKIDKGLNNVTMLKDGDMQNLSKVDLSMYVLKTCKSRLIPLKK